MSDGFDTITWKHEELSIGKMLNDDGITLIYQKMVWNIELDSTSWVRREAERRTEISTEVEIRILFI